MLIAIVTRNPHAPSDAAYLPPSGAPQRPSRTTSSSWTSSPTWSWPASWCAPLLYIEAPNPYFAISRFLLTPLPSLLPLLAIMRPIPMFFSPPSPESHSHLSPVCHSEDNVTRSSPVQSSLEHRSQSILNSRPGKSDKPKKYCGVVFLGAFVPGTGPENAPPRAPGAVQLPAAGLHRGVPRPAHR